MVADARAHDVNQATVKRPPQETSCVHGILITDAGPKNEEIILKNAQNT